MVDSVGHYDFRYTGHVASSGSQGGSHTSLFITSSPLGITLGPLRSGIIHSNDNSNKRTVPLTALLKHSLAQFYQLIGLCPALPPTAIPGTMPDSPQISELFTTLAHFTPAFTWDSLLN